jgi:hypothetical protein
LTQQDIDKLKVGDSVFHINYGKGDILTINKQTKDSLVKIRFDVGSKTIGRCALLVSLGRLSQKAFNNVSTLRNEKFDCYWSCINTPFFYNLIAKISY